MNNLGDWEEDGSFMVLKSSDSTSPDFEVGPRETSEESTISSISNTTVTETEIKPEPMAFQNGADSLNLVETGSGDRRGVTETDFLSMTSYSASSGSGASTDHQMDEVQAEMNEMIKCNQTLKVSLEKANEEMNKHLNMAKEFKLKALAEAFEFKALNEKSRREIEKLKEENKTLSDSLVDYQSQLKEVRELAQPSAPVTSEDFEELESIEKELKRKNALILQKDEQIRDLEEVINKEKQQNEALKEIIRNNEESLKSNNESLSKSDEAVAKSLFEREDLESKIQTYQQRFVKLEEGRTSLELEVADLTKKLEIAKNAYETLNATYDKLILSSDLFRVEKDKNDLETGVKFAALRAEHEQQLELFRMNFVEKDAQINQLTDERQAFRDELNQVNILLQQKMNQLESMQENAVGGNVESIPQTERASHRQVFRVVHPDVDIRQGPVHGTFEFVEAPTQPAAPVSAPVVDSVEPCPVCGKRFDNLKKLQYHAANCGIDEMASRSDPFVFP